jgi:hypothetical protein
MGFPRSWKPGDSRLERRDLRVVVAGTAGSEPDQSRQRRKPNRRRGTRPPGNGRRWGQEDDLNALKERGGADQSDL